MDNSKLDFFIQGYREINLFGLKFQITTTHVCLVIVIAVILIFALFARRQIKKADPKKVPGPFVNAIETVVEFLDNFVVTTMGEKLGPKFVNYIGTIFLFIIVSNLSGLMGLRPPTADFGVTFPLALITWFLIEFNGFKYQKFGKIKGLFEPFFLFFPMNLISEFSTPLSMSLRLFGNILSGTIMMSLIYGLLPKFLTIIWPAALHAYLDVFAGALQAYVFCILTMIFITNATESD